MAYSEVFTELVRLETELWNAADARLRRETGITLGRYEVMRAIGRPAPCRVNDIAHELVVTVGGVSKLVDRIEAAGFCRRQANPDDARSSLIELTPSGRRILTESAAALEDELATRFGTSLTPKRLEDLASALKAIRESASVEQAS